MRQGPYEMQVLPQATGVHLVRQPTTWHLRPVAAAWPCRRTGLARIWRNWRRTRKTPGPDAGAGASATYSARMRGTQERLEARGDDAIDLVGRWVGLLRSRSVWLLCSGLPAGEAKRRGSEQGRRVRVRIPGGWERTKSRRRSTRPDKIAAEDHEAGEKRRRRKG
jgi:hypothetical protein